MTEHYIKAKYKVELSLSGDCILFQREDDRFMFTSLSAFPECVDWIEDKQFSRGLKSWDARTIDYPSWTSQAKDFVRRALAGELEPFWTCNKKVESKSENKCTCPYRNFTWAGGFIGCQCRKEK
jgi:hypothetical protein